jgi:hypothetical protein
MWIYIATSAFAPEFVTYPRVGGKRCNILQERDILILTVIARYLEINSPDRGLILYLKSLIEVRVTSSLALATA